MEKFTIVKNNAFSQLPRTTGVYSFYEKNHLIYIGKAIRIKDRVRNHFQQPSYRDFLFIDKVTKIGFIETQSEIGALLLEARLIKNYLPKFNVVWRDDKNYFYVAVAKNKEGLPYIFITHQPTNRFEIKNLKFKIHYIGPFIDGNALKKTLKLLRKVFPFYMSPRHPKQKCSWCHLDLCPGPDPDLNEYKKNISKLMLVLKGKRISVINLLKKEMKSSSGAKMYENALKTRNRMYALENVMAHALVLFDPLTVEKPALSAAHLWEKTAATLKNIIAIPFPIIKIECYDVSNIQGKHATGSMIVFRHGIKDKSQYKKFRIKMAQEPNDIAMLKEVLSRRFLHQEWPYPEVILIDGGKAQLNVAIQVKNQKKATRHITVISIAKGRQELFIEGKQKPIPLKKLPREVYNLIKNLDNEAHRFAITYHKKLRKRALRLDK